MCCSIKLQTTVACFLFLFCWQNGSAAAQTPKVPDKKIEIIARFKMPNGRRDAVISQVKDTNSDGTLTLSFQRTLSEGFYLGLLQQNSEGGGSGFRVKLFRLKIEEIKENKIAIVKTGKNAAAFLGKNDQLILVRPENLTTAMMKKMPDMVDLDFPQDYFFRSQSQNNLKQLALAVHNYHDAYSCLPPAVIYGADGKPWHSWRVLLLPFMGENKLYKQYKMNEPWNGPNNKKLLSKMPDVFRDPVYPKQKWFYTNYAAIAGEGTPFPLKGASYKKDANGKLTLEYDARTRFRDIQDGTSNTVMFGTVGPDKKIPWMKPDDVPLGKNTSKLGAKSNFSTPFTIDKGKAAMVVWCDGSTSLLAQSVDPKTLRNLFLMADGNVIDGRIRNYSSSRMMSNVTIYRENGKVKAKFSN